MEPGQSIIHEKIVNPTMAEAFLTLIQDVALLAAVDWRLETSEDVDWAIKQRCAAAISRALKIAI